MWDEGLQPERTALSWLRTSLGMFVVSLLLARFAAAVSLWLTVVALTAAMASGVIAVVSHTANERRVRALRQGGTLVSVLWPLVVTATVTALALFALVGVSAF